MTFIDLFFEFLAHIIPDNPILFSKSKKITLTLYKSIKRFPISSFFAYSIIFISFFINILPDSIFNHIGKENWFFYISTFLFFTTSITLLCEQYELKNKTLITLAGAFLIFGLFNSIYFPYWLLPLSIISILFFSFIGKKDNDHILSNFSWYIINKVLFYIGITLLLNISALGVLFLINILFEMGRNLINFEVMLWLIRVEYALIYIVLLSKIPSKLNEDDLYLSHKSKSLILKIITTVVFVYELVLLSYCLKILYLWEMPKGIFTKMVFLLTILGLFVNYLNYPKKEGKGIFKKFDHLFFKLLMPLLILTGLALYIRIDTYDLTFNRVYTILLLLAFFIASIILSVNNKKPLKTTLYLFFIYIFCLSIFPVSKVIKFFQ